MDWEYKGRKMTRLSDFPEGTLGFVYLITDNTNNKFYIGRKSITSTRKKKLTKKELAARSDKRQKTYKYVTSETRGWQSYTGSNEALNKAIEEGARYTKEILAICYNKAELTYFEMKYQFSYGVIEPGNKSYNRNISGKFYTKLFNNNES